MVVAELSSGHFSLLLLSCSPQESGILSLGVGTPVFLCLIFGLLLTYYLVVPKQTAHLVAPKTPSCCGRGDCGWAAIMGHSQGGHSPGHATAREQMVPNLHVRCAEIQVPPGGLRHIW